MRQVELQPGTNLNANWVGGWVDPTVGLDVLTKDKYLAIAGIRTPDRLGLA
jgi:hypothetical protein